MIFVHERAWAVVDGLAGDGHVVGIHHAVNETNQHPLRDEFGLRANYRIEERAIGLFGPRGFRVMPGDDVVGQQLYALDVALRREELERADPDMAGGHPRENRTGERLLTQHGLAGQDGGQRAGRRDAERRHRFADDVFAQDRP
jgi:hypothetical protein